MRREWIRAALIARIRARRPPPELLDPVFTKQNRFVLDDAPFIACLGTRKSGKSHGLAKRLFRSARRYPGLISPYLALTRDSAKNIMWPELKKVNQQYGLGAEFIDSQLEVRVGEGTIKLFGADMANLIDRIRGPAYGDAAIDEAQAMRERLLEALIDDIVKPAQIVTNASLILAGTPGPVCKGTFHKATETPKLAASRGWSYHFLSLWENPYLPDAKGFVAGIMKRRQWTKANPTLRREYYGEWVIDLGSLVYKFDPKANIYEQLPRGHEWLRVLVIDLGFVDQAAFGITTYSMTHTDVYQEHAEGESEMIPKEIAGRARQLVEHYHPYAILMDTGGLGKSIAEEFRRRYHLPIRSAEKREKLTNIRLMNGDFTDKHLWVHRELDALHNQYQTLVKNEKGLETEGLPNDLCDVSLYGYREARHYLGKEPEDAPKPGTEAHARAEEARIEKRMLERFQDQESQEKDWTTRDEAA